MTTPLSAPVTYQEALAMATAAAAQRTAAPTAERAVTVTSIAADSIIAARDRAAAHAKTAIGELWSSVNPYSAGEVADFAAQAARIMVAAQSAAARAAAVGQSQQLLAIGVVAPATQSVPIDVRASSAVVVGGKLVLHRPTVDVDYAGAGTAKITAADMTTAAVFQRPAQTYRYVQSQGGQDAGNQALQRISTLVDDNLMLAQRLAQHQVIENAVKDLDRRRSKTKVIGYRRVIHPELSRGGTCGMCIAASDRVYNVGQLMPIHAHCKCTIAAVTEEHDPADDLNAVDLGQLYKDSGGTSSAHLKRTRYRVDEHGELGPVLTPKAKYKPRTTKSKVRAGGTALPGDQPAQSDVAKRQIEVLEANLAKMRGEDVPESSPKIAYHNKLLAKLREQVASAAGGGGGDGGEPPRRSGAGSMDDWDDDRIPGSKRRHILDGDAKGGGHRHDSTTPNKTLFPADWSDAKCLAAVSAALDEPYLTSDDVEALRSTVFLNRYAMVDGVRVVARLLKADGSLQTAFPLDGDGVFKTGRKDGTVKKALPLGSVRGVPLPS